MIGVLAYGSLITDPGSIFTAVTVGRTEGVPTPFPVEFARSSSKRAGAPTLVPVCDCGCPVHAVVFAVDVSPEEGASIVYRRGNGRGGITYLMDAERSGIEAPLTSSYKAHILEQTGAADLTAALEAIRSKLIWCEDIQLFGRGTCSACADRGGR
jgi:hypothetical protein